MLIRHIKFAVRYAGSEDVHIFALVTLTEYDVVEFSEEIFYEGSDGRPHKLDESDPKPESRENGPRFPGGRPPPRSG